ncbi:MAG TPA: AMP-binding protein, partial [Geminicoccaceae bacterium]|nr:AMP-binding protein [Geminicoccaceae bacterium]
RPEWAVACLAVLAAGAIVMPLSEQVTGEELERAVADSGCRWVLTARAHLKSVAALDRAAELQVVLLGDDGAGAGGDDEEGLRARGWRELLAEPPDGGLPAQVGPDDPAALLYTSGTTGAPKGVLLSHGNIAGNIRGLIAEPLAGPDDRVLMPLPLHHAYPLTVGLLAPLTVGAAVVLPAGVTGPQVIRALNEARVTVMIGVPRLYVGLMQGVEARVDGGGRLARLAFDRLLGASIWLRRRLGRRVGRALFRPLHRRLGPDLRLLASGGARLDPELAWKLEGLGYEVLTGYGLTETSPILTFNPPGRAKLESAGLPVPGVELRILPVEEAPEGQGEVLARGPNVFRGYWNNREATEEAFAEGGWFRTGDLGSVDGDGYLHIGGRSKEVIVLAGGENIYPEDVERIYGESPLVREIGVLEHDGRLVALIVPEEEAVRERDGGSGRARELLRGEIGRLSRRVPSHARLGDLALTREPLPRTQIGKLRRHELPAIYAQEKSGRGRPEPEPARTAEDEALLASHPAGAVFAWLKERYGDHPLTLDTSPQFDLGLDSFEWMSLAMELDERFGVRLSDEQLTEAATLRDLLRAVNESAGARPTEERAERGAELSPEQERWLTPPGPLVTLLQRALFGLNRAVMRGAFRLRVQGLDRLPAEGPLLLTPNHASYLDPFAIAAALPWRQLRRTYWAGWTGLLFRGPLTRAFSRATQVVPVDPERGLSSTLAYGRAVLERGRALTWFPEGGRSATGELQPFLPGVGLLLDRTGAPAVPVWIEGSHDALPPDRLLPRLRPVRVVFGAPVTARELVGRADGEEADEARIAERLRDVVAGLGGRVDGGRGGGGEKASAAAASQPRNSQPSGSG